MKEYFLNKKRQKLANLLIASIGALAFWIFGILLAMPDRISRADGPIFVMGILAFFLFLLVMIVISMEEKARTSDADHE